MKTMMFEEMYKVSVDDFEDTVSIDRFVESKEGRPLEVKDTRSIFTLGEGNIFKSVNRSREDLEASTEASFKGVEAQYERLRTMSRE